MEETVRAILTSSIMATAIVVIGLIFLSPILTDMDYKFACATPVTKFTNLKCETFDETHITFRECRLRFIKRNLVGLNIHANLLKPLTNAVVRKIIIYEKNLK